MFEARDGGSARRVDRAVLNEGAPDPSRLLQARPACSAAVSPARCASILSTLKDISTATPDVQGCRQMLECIAHELQAEQGVLILSNPLTQGLEFVVHNMDASVPRLYADHFGDLDPVGLPDYVKGKLSLLDYDGSPSSRPPAPAVFDLMDVVDYKSFVATEFYNDFLKTGGIHYDLVALVSATSSARGAVCLHRALDHRPFSGEEVAILDMIAPFVGNHLEKMMSSHILSVLQTAEGKGVILCDSAGRVLYCNDIARELCSSLGAVGGTSRPVEETSFVGHVLGGLEALAESRDLEIGYREVILKDGAPGRLVTLEPRGRGNTAWTEPLKERFGLTEREIEVLHHVMAGGGNREIAQALFIAECTVKKHLQSISVKVGARTRMSIAHTVRQELGLDR